MINLKKFRLHYLLLSLFLVSCTTKFLPDASKYQEKKGTICLSMPLVEDERENKDIDKRYEENTLTGFENALISKLMSSGLFEDINGTCDPEFKLEVKLLRLETRYENELIHFPLKITVGVFTGGIGMIVYNSLISEDFYADVVVHLKFIRILTGEVLIDQKIIYQTKEFHKLSNDGPENSAKMIENSIEGVFNQMIQLLKEKVQ